MFEKNLIFVAPANKYINLTEKKLNHTFFVYKKIVYTIYLWIQLNTFTLKSLQ